MYKFKRYGERNITIVENQNEGEISKVILNKNKA